jgi:hypothetical protein
MAFNIKRSNFEGGYQYPVDIISSFNPVNPTLYNSGGSSSAHSAPSPGPVPIYNPSFKNLPAYNAPKWNEGEIDTLTQKRAAPGLRDLRQQVQRVTGRRYDNPQVGRMTLREALQGYGSGVSKVMGSASETASNEYSQKFGRESQNAQNEYASNVAQTSAENQFNADKSKTQFGGEMTKWSAGNESYERGLERASREKMAQTAFDKEWDLWLRQQNYQPVTSGAAVSRNRATGFGPGGL